MATYLIDTNIVIDALNHKRNRNEILIGLAQQGHTLACSPITIAEVYAGMRPKEETHTAGFLRTLELYPITFPVAELAGTLKRDYARKGKVLTIPDTLIAATALHNKLILITDNTADFPMKDLALHNLSHAA